jgi:hypothetical protein
MGIRTGLAVAAAGALALAPAAPAATPTYSAQGSQTVNGHTLSQKAVGQVLSSDATTITVATACTATATPDGAGTGIVVCDLIGADGRRFTTGDDFANPGPADATGGVVTVPKQLYRLCVRSNTVFTDATAINGQNYCSPPA